MWENISDYSYEEKTYTIPRGSTMIWCLFSVANEYDQPENNLECFWFEKPSFEQLARGLGWKPFIELGDEAILYVVNLWKGKIVQESPGGTTYRLEQVKESTKLC